MIKECKAVETTDKEKTQRNNDEWHYEFAAKMIEGWPEWKKAIYEAKPASSNEKR